MWIFYMYVCWCVFVSVQLTKCNEKYHGYVKRHIAAKMLMNSSQVCTINYLLHFNYSIHMCVHGLHCSAIIIVLVVVLVLYLWKLFSRRNCTKHKWKKKSRTRIIRNILFNECIQRMRNWFIASINWSGCWMNE